MGNQQQQDPKNQMKGSGTSMGQNPQSGQKGQNPQPGNKSSGQDQQQQHSGSSGGDHNTGGSRDTEHGSTRSYGSDQERAGDSGRKSHE